jgi:putative transposase
MPDSLEALDLLLVAVAKPRVVHRDGIRFQGQRYIDPALAGYVGEPVTIRYDPRDVAEIRVFHHDRLVATAICPELADRTVSLKDIVAARRQRRRQLRAEIDRRSSVIDQLLDVHRSAPPPGAPVTDEAAAASRLKRYRNE